MTLGPARSNGSSRTATNNRYIVSIKGRLDENEDFNFLTEDGFSHVETFDFPEENFPGMPGDVLLVTLDQPELAAQALSQLSEDPRVDLVEPDLEFELQEVVSADQEPLDNGDATFPAGTRRPNDLRSRQWGLNSRGGTDIDAPEAWDRTVGSRTNGPVIAVIDTGVDTSHPDLKDNLWTNPGEIPGNGRDDDGNGVVDDVHGFDAYHRDGTPEDAHGHGTHCAGILGATGNNKRGMTGVNWQARIMPVKIFNNSEKPRTSSSAILRGISYATNNGARLTSNSWGGPTRRGAVKRAFERSRAFHVMAAGNDGQDNDEKPFYPASYGVSNGISVAAVNTRGQLPSFSNYGKRTVDVAAPGTSIYSTLPGGRYGNRQGTSMAAPFVTGVAGLLLSAAPTLTNSQIRSVLIRGVEKKRGLADKVATGGVINAKNSLDFIRRG